MSSCLGWQEHPPSLTPCAYQSSKNQGKLKRGTLNFLGGLLMLSRRLARYYLVIALFQSPLSERSVTVSVSLRSPVVTPVAQRRQVTLSATVALRISRSAWLLIV